MLTILDFLLQPTIALLASIWFVLVNIVLIQLEPMLENLLNEYGVFIGLLLFALVMLATPVAAVITQMLRDQASKMKSISELQKQYYVLRAQVEEQKIDIRNLQQQNTLLEAENNTVREQLITTQTQLHATLVENAKLMQEVVQLRVQIEKWERRHKRFAREKETAG